MDSVMRRLFILSGLFMLFFALSVWPLHANNTAFTGPRIVVFGDSLASGYGLPAQDSFPRQLEVALRQAGYDHLVVNAGVAGDTTAGGLARLDWAMHDEAVLYIVELGANDALRGLDPVQSRANLDRILSRLKNAGQGNVLLAGMKAPRNMGAAYVAEFDAIYPELADMHQVAFYPFFLDGVATIPELNQSDGIHPNARGVAVIVERLLPSIESLLMD